MLKPTLGIYGPKSPERAGGGDYIALSLCALSKFFDCAHISNRDWRDPREFDYVLYHIGSNRFHYCAFRALKVMRGPTVFHEYNCLNYYFNQWDKGLLSKRDETFILSLFSKKYNTHFLNKEMLYSFFSEIYGLNAYYERNYIDVGIEELFIKDVTVAFIHSPFYLELLRNRYPNLEVVYIPHIAKPFNKLDINRARQYLNLQLDDFLFGSYGFIAKAKRLDKVIAAWRNWNAKPSNVKLLILGENSESLEIPKLKDLIYIDYLEDVRDFDAFLGASDCAIQLRYPTVGETSGVMTKIIANGKLLITSDTEYQSVYKGNDNVFLIKPDEHEIESLIKVFKEALTRQISQKFDEHYSPETYAQKLYEEIVNTNEHRRF